MSRYPQRPMRPDRPEDSRSGNEADVAKMMAKLKSRTKEVMRSERRIDLPGETVGTVAGSSSVGAGAAHPPENTPMTEASTRLTGKPDSSGLAVPQPLSPHTEPVERLAWFEAAEGARWDSGPPGYRIRVYVTRHSSLHHPAELQYQAYKCVKEWDLLLGYAPELELAMQLCEQHLQNTVDTSRVTG